MTRLDDRDRFQGCLLGLAAGDAVGTTLEFTQRDRNPAITDMVGGGPFGLRPGEWTDDTSMALCLAASLVEQGRFDARDQMDRYCAWAESGYLSSNGVCFDIGNTVSGSLARYRKTGEPFSGPTAPNTAGNGSLMRLCPVVLFFHPDHAAVITHASESSRTTHGAPECLDGCTLMAELLMRALSGANKDDVLSPVDRPFCSAALDRIAGMEFTGKTRDDVRGSGYVVDCLEAALWCFHQTTSFRDAVLLAANLGDDADTTAAVCGQIAGAHYGASGIPSTWSDQLAMNAEIAEIAVRLHETALDVDIR